MEIKIDKEGYLWILRAGAWKEQSCPYPDAEVGCGDWCSLFGEPVIARYEPDKLNFLNLCSVALKGKIIDEREQVEDEP